MLAGTDQLQSFSSTKELANLIAECPASRLVDARNGFARVAPFDDELKPVKKVHGPEDRAGAPTS
jgi:hypothetical protein